MSEECDSYVEDWDADWAALEEEVLVLVNAERADGANCGSEGYFGPADPLTMHPLLRCAARAHSKWMGVNNSMTHASPGGPFGDDMVERAEYAGYTSWSYLGENIAQWYATPSAVMAAWMSSDGHCSNIMSPDFEEIGVGYYYDGTAWWTQDFGTSW
ncbi:MAG: CAP domain-containing protein [Deltaproteobacteria bacterium]|nr:CAP domain-containing protein [Deltaproteobacteria bacterium]